MKPRLWSEYFEILMDFEGVVFEDDPDDPGGATKFGIDQRSHPDLNIMDLTIEKAERIYLDEFWRSFAAELPSPLALLVFDFCVNAGEGAAVKAIQRALGMGVIDGIVGPFTREAIRNAMSNGQATLIAAFTLCRINFYERLVAQRPRFHKYLRGWRRRAKTMRGWTESKI
jgi:type VI secretion system secreted protein VgrG